MQPIHILLTDAYSDWEIAPLAGLGQAFFDADIRFCTPNGGDVTSVAGLTIRGLPALTTFETGPLVVCGGPAFEGAVCPDFSSILINAYEKDCVIAGICGGTLALAKAGLLDGVRHTSNRPAYIKGFVPSYCGEDFYVDQPAAVRDGQIITAPASAPASLAVEVLVSAGLDRDKVGVIKEMLSREHVQAS